MSETLPTLSFGNIAAVEGNAFHGDVLERRALADSLTRYIDRLRAGAVLAIDAPWGEGKTWFGKNWAKKLKDEGYRTAYIDAFEQDYVEDPFMLLASELISMVEDKTKAKTQLTKKAAGVAKATLSIVTKVGMGLATKHILAGVDLGDEIEKATADISDEAAQLTSRFIEESFTKYEQNKQTIVSFKEELKKYALSQEKPIVIFIDELDRCKPSFAVGLIERIKHFFDVPNVVFVLMLNRDQLEKAVKGVYGAETDGVAYLGKFVNFFFALPKPTTNTYQYERILTNFIELSMDRYQFARKREHDGFINYIKFWAPFFEFSLRDIEKSIALYAFAYPVNNLSWLLPYLIALKIKMPVLFSRLIAGNLQAHLEAKEIIEAFMKDAERKMNTTAVQRVLPFYLEWHNAHLNAFTDLGEFFSKEIQDSWHIQKPELFSTLAKKIELEIER